MKNKIAVVTAAGQGIGRATAERAMVIINPLAIRKRALCLVYPETRHPDARILAFADWLKSVVARIQAG